MLLLLMFTFNRVSTRTYCWVAISVGYPLFTHAYYAQLPPHVVAMKYAVAIRPTITGASSVGSLVAGGIGAFCDLRTFERHALAVMTVALNFRLALQAAALGGAADGAAEAGGGHGMPGSGQTRAADAGINGRAPKKTSCTQIPGCSA